jgi:hypothetical protein
MSSPSPTPPGPPPNRVPFFVTLRGSDPDALVSDVVFVCALRDGFAQLALVPLSAVQVVAARDVETGASFPVLVSQLDGSCDDASRLLSPSLGRAGRRLQRRGQALAPIRFEVAVDVSKSSLPLAIATNATSSASAAGAERAVRAAVEAAFAQNRSLADSVFSAATLAACSAQGIASSACPGPSSLLVSGGTAAPGGATAASSSPAPESESAAVVPAMSAALAVSLLLVVVLSVSVWRGRRRTGAAAAAAAMAAATRKPSLSSSRPQRGVSVASKTRFAVRQLVPALAGSAAAALFPPPPPPPLDDDHNNNLVFHNPVFNPSSGSHPAVGRGKQSRVRNVFDPSAAAR